MHATLVWYIRDVNSGLKGRPRGGTGTILTLPHATIPRIVTYRDATCEDRVPKHPRLLYPYPSRGTRYEPMTTPPAVSDSVLHILLALADRPRHGYAIVQEIEGRTDGAVRLGTGTLYTALKRLRADGLIAEVEPDGSESSGRSRRTYGLTPQGHVVLDEQAARLRALVDHALAKKALRLRTP